MSRNGIKMTKVWLAWLAATSHSPHKPVQERPVYKQRSQEEHSVLTFLFLYIIKPLFSVIIYRYYIKEQILCLFF